MRNADREHKVLHFLRSHRFGRAPAAGGASPTCIATARRGDARSATNPFCAPRVVCAPPAWMRAVCVTPCPRASSSKRAAEMCPHSCLVSAPARRGAAHSSPLCLSASLPLCLSLSPPLALSCSSLTRRGVCGCNLTRQACRTRQSTSNGLWGTSRRAPPRPASPTYVPVPIRSALAPPRCLRAIRQDPGSRGASACQRHQMAALAGSREPAALGPAAVRTPVHPSSRVVGRGARWWRLDWPVRPPSRPDPRSIRPGLSSCADQPAKTRTTY